MKDIEVRYIDGFSKEEFEILKEIDGLEINIPENKNNISAVLSTPEDYILIFSLYFGSKVIEKLFDKVYEKIADKIISSITKIWNKAKESKPCIIKSDCAPIYKKPKAKIIFKISENDTSEFEITPNMSEKEIKKFMKVFIKLVKLQYKNRQKENDLKLKINN